MFFFAATQSNDFDARVWWSHSQCPRNSPHKVDNKYDHPKIWQHIFSKVWQDVKPLWPFTTIQTYRIVDEHSDWHARRHNVQNLCIKFERSSPEMVSQPPSWIYWFIWWTLARVHKKLFRLHTVLKNHERYVGYGPWTTQVAPRLYQAFQQSDFRDFWTGWWNRERSTEERHEAQLFI